jgi:hypothetical protein
VISIDFLLIVVVSYRVHPVLVNHLRLILPASDSGAELQQPWEDPRRCNHKPSVKLHPRHFRRLIDPSKIACVLNNDIFNFFKSN